MLFGVTKGPCMKSLAGAWGPEAILPASWATEEAPSLATYPHAQFFAGYRAHRRRSFSFWNRTLSWVFNTTPECDRTKLKHGKRTGLTCGLLEKIWHVIFCRSCREEPRESDVSLPLALRIPAKHVICKRPN